MVVRLLLVGCRLLSELLLSGVADALRLYIDLCLREFWYCVRCVYCVYCLLNLIV